MKQIGLLHIGPNLKDAEQTVALYERLLKAVNVEREPWLIRWVLKRTALRAATGMFAVSNVSVADCNFSGTTNK